MRHAMTPGYFEYREDKTVTNDYSDMSKGDLISLLSKRNAPAVQGEPEIIERLASAERRCSEAISEAYKLRRLWEFAASMIAFNSKKITPRGGDEKRLIELAKGADHGMAWSGRTDGWITESMTCSIAVTQPAERQPDVTQLVEALETTAEKLKLVMETAQYIQHTIDKALAPAREALAAHQKQETRHDNQ